VLATSAAATKATVIRDRSTASSSTTTNTPVARWAGSSRKPISVVERDPALAIRSRQATRATRPSGHNSATEARPRNPLLSSFIGKP
jgi:hypothetical protein